MKKMVNIMLVGVGGQGVLLASELICRVALKSGYDVKKSEVHGMAQRGGSVVSNVRIGEKIYSPLIARGETDILLAFEQMEALRWINYLKKDGVAIVNEQKIMPLFVAIGRGEYPKRTFEFIAKKTDKIVRLDALELARKAGHHKAANVVMVGALSNYLDVDEETWKKTVEEIVPPKTLKINLKAFELGRKTV